MGFLDRLLGRGRQAMGSVARGGTVNPEDVVERQKQQAEQRATSAPQEAEARAQREAQQRAEGK